MRIPRTVTAAAALLLLSACVPNGVDAPTSPAPPTPAATSPADLATLRQQYGLPDCPTTDPEAEQLDGGLPRTALTCLGSDTVVNLAGLPRTPTVINLWAQWCAPCRAESPYLRAVSADLTEVSFIGINYDDPQPDWALEFADLVGWDYPHIMDPQKELQVPLKVPGLPTTYFVDADGRIAGVHPGELESEQQLRDLTAKYLGVS